MVHYWRKAYRQGRLGENETNNVRRLPVSVSEPTLTVVAKRTPPMPVNVEGTG